MDQLDTATNELAARITQAIVNPLLELFFAVGLLVFVFGTVEFMVGLYNDTSQRKEEGKQHMLWGLAGMFIMTTALAILNLTINTSTGFFSQ